MGSASDLVLPAVTPSDDLQVPWPPVLPLPLALRSMLELAAPSWEPFIFDTSRNEPLRTADVAGEATRRVLARETSRPYRSDKGRAYKSFSGSEAIFTELIVRLAAGESSDDAVADALDHIARDAAVIGAYHSVKIRRRARQAPHLITRLVCAGQRCRDRRSSSSASSRRLAPAIQAGVVFAVCR
jgi:hypothetical protein